MELSTFGQILKMSSLISQSRRYGWKILVPHVNLVRAGCCTACYCTTDVDRHLVANLNWLDVSTFHAG